MTGNVFGQMKDLYKMRKQASEMQKKLRKLKLIGESKSGHLKLHMNGAQEFEDVEIDDILLDTEMKKVFKQEMQEAFKDFQKKLQKQARSEFDMDDVKNMLG